MIQPGGEMGAVTVNPVQTTTYDLNAAANPITFGAQTAIGASSGSGVYGNLAASWTVANYGGIKGETAGVWFEGAGSVTNAGAITGTNAIFGIGVLIGSGGSVNNQSGGKISGTDLGVYVRAGTGAVTNAGAISGMGLAAVWLDSGGAVNNLSGGTITGGNAEGVFIEGGGTVTNAGSISGGTASVEFGGAGANTLTLDTGSMLTGNAIGSAASGATNALVLQGTGTANNNFDRFNMLDVEASGDWTLGGDSTFGAATVSSGASLDVTGDLTMTGAISGDMQIGEGGKVELQSGATDDGGIFFADPSNSNIGGALQIDGATMPAASIGNFAPDDAINLANIEHKTSYEAEWTPAAGTLQIVDTANANAVVATLSLPGQSLSGELVSLGSDDVGGTLIGLASFDLASVGPGDVVYSSITGKPYSAYEYEYSTGNAMIGSNYYYTDVTGQAYTGEEVDYNGAGQLTQTAFTGVTGAAYSAFQYDYVGGVFSGSQFTFTTVPTGATYSSYEVDYDQGGNFAGDQFFFTNIQGQFYTGEQEDFDASGALSSVLLTGITDQAYSSLQLDYSAGTYEGYQAFLTGITGQSYTSEEVDASAAGQLEKVIYSGMTSTPYSSVEADYSGGALADFIYNFTNVTGESYYSYQVEDNTSGAQLQETQDLNSGGHDLTAMASGQTLTSLGDDTMTGSGSTTFVLNAVYGADTIANLTDSDIVSMPTSEFANFTALSGKASFATGAAVITAGDGDTLTLDGIATLAQLKNLSGDFTFHS
jgi:hypothetical protein